jgi:undecaprenyl diphosphate synthase
MANSANGPKHIALVMDGNGRWAKRRLLPRVAGHRQGLESLKRCVKACIERGVTTLTTFAFSSENWDRPAEEVTALMDLLVKGLTREVPTLHESGVKIVFLGDRTSLSSEIKQGIADAEMLTEANTRLTFNVCFNYGGQWDIVQAAQQLAAAGEVITQASLAGRLVTAHCGDPDLLIRTGGEVRISNFLLWQVAYTELYFSDKLWPEFDEAALDEAIQTFKSRERRFGKTSEQVFVGTSK